MGIIYFENGKSRYIDHYDPFPDDEKEYRRAKRYRRPEGLPKGWW